MKFGLIIPSQCSALSPARYQLSLTFLKVSCVFEYFISRINIGFYRISRTAWAGRAIGCRLVVGGDSFADSDNADINADNFPVGTKAVGSPDDVVLPSA